MKLGYAEVLQFWFEELEPSQHWVKDKELDNSIKMRFGDVHHRASMGELNVWRSDPRGRLAEIIILDQFSRNIYRDRPESFAFDGMALILAQEAVSVGADKDLPMDQRAFMYLPYMHSESLIVHEQAVKLFDQPGMENNLEFEHKHKMIIERFGRYPHRNSILGRTFTPEELEFLKQPGSSF